MITGRDDSTAVSYPAHSNRPVKVWEDNYTSNHLMKISLMYQRRHKFYQKPYFAFLKGAPAGGKGADGNKPYITDQKVAITFKLELHQLIALGKAFQMYGLGSGKRLTGRHIIWADPSKTAFASDEDKLRKGKSFTLSEEEDTSKGAQPGDRIIMATFNRGKKKYTNPTTDGKKDYDSFTLTFKPFEALAIADSITFLVSHARDLILKNFQPSALPQPEQKVKQAAQNSSGVAADKAKPNQDQSPPPKSEEQRPSVVQPASSSPVPAQSTGGIAGTGEVSRTPFPFSKKVTEAA